MAEKTQRPRVNIRFRYNCETGEVEEFIIDDNSPDRSEDYHDSVARAIVGLLARQPEITDAGPRHEMVRERLLRPAVPQPEPAEERKATQTQ